MAIPPGHLMDCPGIWHGFVGAIRRAWLDCYCDAGGVVPYPSAEIATSDNGYYVNLIGVVPVVRVARRIARADRLRPAPRSSG